MAAADFFPTLGDDENFAALAESFGHAENFKRAYEIELFHIIEDENASPFHIHVPSTSPGNLQSRIMLCSCHPQKEYPANSFPCISNLNTISMTGRLRDDQEGDRLTR